MLYLVKYLCWIIRTNFEIELSNHFCCMVVLIFTMMWNVKCCIMLSLSQVSPNFTFILNKDTISVQKQRMILEDLRIIIIYLPLSHYSINSDCTFTVINSSPYVWIPCVSNFCYTLSRSCLSTLNQLTMKRKI